MSPLMLSGLALLTSGVMLLLMLLRTRQNDARLTEPRCNFCDYDLRAAVRPTRGVPTPRCPECGVDLSGPGAVRWGQHPRDSWRGTGVYAGIAGGAVLIAGGWIYYTRPVTAAITRPVFPFPGTRVFPLVAYPSPPAFYRSPVYTPPPPPTTASLIANLSADFSNYSAWNLLTGKLTAGILTQAETNQIVDIVIANASNPQRMRTSNAVQFLRQADTRFPIDAGRVMKLAQACDPVPQAVVASRARQGETVHFLLRMTDAHQRFGYGFPLALDRVNALQSIQRGSGDSLPAEAHVKFEFEPNHDADLLSSNGEAAIGGEFRSDLPAGDYHVTFNLKSALLPAGATPRMARNLPGQPKNWPAARALWSTPLTVPLTILPADQSPIQLVTDPALLAGVQSSVQVKSAQAVRTQDGSNIDVSLTFKANPCPVSFKMYVRVLGVEHYLGGHMAGVNENSIAGIGTGVHIGNLPADVHSIDLILRPDPIAAERAAGIDHIWGSTIEMTDLPLTRYDLPGNANTP